MVHLRRHQEQINLLNSMAKGNPLVLTEGSREKELMEKTDPNEILPVPPEFIRENMGIPVDKKGNPIQPVVYVQKGFVDPEQVMKLERTGYTVYVTKVPPKDCIMEMHSSRYDDNEAFRAKLSRGHRVTGADDDRKPGSHRLYPQLGLAGLTRHNVPADERLRYFPWLNRNGEQCWFQFTNLDEADDGMARIKEIRNGATPQPNEVVGGWDLEVMQTMIRGAQALGTHPFTPFERANFENKSVPDHCMTWV
ncbi:MAG: hypothetical protein V3W28_06085 [Thermoplasmata archaeon]